MIELGIRLVASQRSADLIGESDAILNLKAKWQRFVNIDSRVFISEKLSICEKAWFKESRILIIK